MNDRDLEILKANVDKCAHITCYDGERILAKVLLVSEEEQDVVYDLISTNRVSHYEKFDQQPAYRIAFHEIESVEPLDADDPKR